MLGAVTDPVVRAHYLQRLGRLSRTGERELSGMITPANRRKDGGRSAVRQPVAAIPPGDAREEFLLALLLRYPALRDDGLEIPDEVLVNSENRALLSALKAVGSEAGADATAQIEAVNSALPVELQPYVERLSLRKMPAYDLKEARRALDDCMRLLGQRRLKEEKQAIGSMLAEREAEVGASLLAEAASGEQTDDERVLEAMSLQAQDMRTGLRLHGREDFDGASTAETGKNG